MRLSTRLAMVGLVLTICVSLVPFQGWRTTGAAPFDFLLAPLPRVITVVDVASNVLAYVPLAGLIALALRFWLQPWPAALVSVGLAATVSLVLEIAQNYLPNRVPSNLDVAANGIGAMIGAACALRWGYLATSGGVLERAWHRLRDEGRAQDAGVAVLGLWCLAQWSPRTPLFGFGGMRQMLGVEAPGDFSVERFVVFEALAVGAGMLAAGLVAASLLRRHRRTLALGVLASGMAVKTLGVTLLASHSDPMAWASPGALRGMAVGVTLLLVCAGFHVGLRSAIAACAILLATGVNNLIPDNPYLLPEVPPFPAAQWLNFDGLSRLAAVVWPFIALSWLMTTRRER